MVVGFFLQILKQPLICPRLPEFCKIMVSIPSAVQHTFHGMRDMRDRSSNRIRVCAYFLKVCGDMPRSRRTLYFDND